MADYAVNTTGLRQYADQISALQREMNAVAIRLGAMQLGSILKINATSAMIGRITDCKKAVINQGNNLQKLSDCLDQIATCYEQCEKGLLEPGSSRGMVRSNGAGASADWSNIVTNGTAIGGSGIAIPSAVKNIVSWIAKKNAPFALMSSILGFASGGAKGVVKGFKELTRAIGIGSSSIFRSGGNLSVDWKKMLGFNASGIGGLKDSWSAFKSSMKVSSKNSIFKNASAICKWGTYALTVVESGVENYEEYNGDMSNVHFWGETIVEGAVDVGLAIGAGVLAAAALPATAPGIVVGAVGAAAVWAANGLVEWATGADIAENISTWAGNATEAVAKGYQAAKEGVQKATEQVGKSISKAAKWIGGLFS